MVLEERVEDNCTDRIINEVLQGIKEERTILRTLTYRQAKDIRYNSRKNCRVKTCYLGEDGSKCRRKCQKRLKNKQLLDDRKETRRYWKLREEALDRTGWRTRYGRGCGNIVRQTRNDDDDDDDDVSGQKVKNRMGSFRLLIFKTSKL